jgi:hypothetical protein
MARESSPSKASRSSFLSIAAIIIALSTAAYYVADSVTGRDTNLAEQLRVLGFCPNATAAELAAELGDCPKLVTFDAMNGDLIPSLDDIFSLGSTDFRWKDLQLGPGTLYMQDQVTGDQAAINVIDGALLLDGTDSLRIGNIRLTAEGLESIASDADITIGNFGDEGYALFPTGIKFSDGSTMTSAADLGVAGTGGARGPRGLTGAQGVPGLTGAVGATGATGAAGPRGTTGAPGASGAPGATGSQGIAGPTGSPGPSGAPGANGEPGASGAPGATGEPGPEGPAGGSTLEVWSADGFAAIDLTKQVVVLGVGNWTLADGVQGQIIYFVASTGSDTGNMHILVNHLRYQNGSITTAATDYDWHPFTHTSGGTRFPLITIAIFFDGSWNVSAGEAH